MTNVCPVCQAKQDAGLLCSNCCDRLERDLGDVAAIVGELDITISKQDRMGSGKGAPARERNAVNWGASQIADDLQNTLTTWARDVSDVGFLAEHSTSPTRAAARILLNHVGLIRRHAAVEELVDEITEAINRARRAVDRPVERKFFGTCLAEFPDPEGRAVTCLEEIWARPTAHEVTCKVCGSTHEIAERRAWLLQRAENMIVTVSDAASYMGSVGHITVTQASIRGYLHRGKIAYRAPIEAKRIRLGDLLAVLLDESEKVDKKGAA